MTEELEAMPVAVKVIIVAILACSAYLWIQHIQRTKNEIIPDAQTKRWKLSWVDFGLLVCALVVSVSLTQLIFSPLIQDELNNINGEELTPWIAVFGVLTLHLPLLAVFIGARQFFPNQYATKLNTQGYSLGAAIKEAGKQFLMSWPIISIASYAWVTLLFILNYLGLIDDFAPQGLISIFTENENLLATGILLAGAVILAPITEELVFRGFIYRFLKSKTSTLAAQVLSGALFALIHVNLLSFLPLVVLGILLARAYEKSGNILVPICFHACFNAFTLTMLFINVYSN